MARAAWDAFGRQPDVVCNNCTKQRTETVAAEIAASVSQLDPLDVCRDLVADGFWLAPAGTAHGLGPAILGPWVAHPLATAARVLASREVPPVLAVTHPYAGGVRGVFKKRPVAANVGQFRGWFVDGKYYDDGWRYETFIIGEDGTFTRNAPASSDGTTVELRSSSDPQEALATLLRETTGNRDGGPDKTHADEYESTTALTALELARS